MRVARIAEISKVFLEEGLAASSAARAAGGDARAGDEATDRDRGARLRRALERLGPTFVKFGQLLATRVDLFSDAFLRELRQLHTHVPPFETELARKLVAAELGRELSEVFSEFPDAPAASASIAQVYRARLRESGEYVAVKVQRPNLEETLLSDLDVLIKLSELIDWLVPAYHRSMVHTVAREYASRARTEIDFVLEAEAMAEFAKVLATLPEFRVPKVYLELCTPRLLVMEWLDGELLDRIEGAAGLVALGVDPCAFSSSMLRLQLSMSYEHGFVHGDTHPGNVILMPSGQIGLIDFGLHGQVPRWLCDRMLELLSYQSAGRIDDAVNTFLEIFVPGPAVDLDAFRRELRAVLASGAGPTARESRITGQLIDGLRVGARYQLKAQSDLFVVLRNLTIVEGIVLRYCPELDIVTEARRVVADILRRRALGSTTFSDLQAALPMLLLALSQRPKLAERLLRLERSFVESRNLGEFLRHEGVIEPSAPKARGSGASRGLIALLAALVGALLACLVTWWR
jgi:ubiquinone biosynthesis protein